MFKARLYIHYNTMVGNSHKPINHFRRILKPSVQIDKINNFSRTILCGECLTNTNGFISMHVCRSMHKK